jgi:hypothetical protein
MVITMSSFLDLFQLLLSIPDILLDFCIFRNELQDALPDRDGFFD